MKISTYTLPTSGAAVAEWETPLSRYQVVNVGDGLLIGYRLLSGGDWVTSYVVEPERFGPYGTPSEIGQWAERLLNQPEEDG